jgi:hypothetical protein
LPYQRVQRIDPSSTSFFYNLLLRLPAVPKSCNLKYLPKLCSSFTPSSFAGLEFLSDELGTFAVVACVGQMADINEKHATADTV